MSSLPEIDLIAEQVSDEMTAADRREYEEWLDSIEQEALASGLWWPEEPPLGVIGEDSTCPF